MQAAASRVAHTISRSTPKATSGLLKTTARIQHNMSLSTCNVVLRQTQTGEMLFLEQAEHMSNILCCHLTERKQGRWPRLQSLAITFMRSTKTVDFGVST